MKEICICRICGFWTEDGYPELLYVLVVVVSLDMNILI